MTRAVTVTGTRSTGHRSLDEYATLFASYLGPFTGEAHFYVGGAKGIDSMALLWLAGTTGATMTVVTPGTLDQQPADARQAIARTRYRISEVIELATEELNTAAFHARNRWMVDRSDMTIGFPLNTAGTSGTWQTLDYTAEREKPRLIVPV